MRLSEVKFLAVLHTKRCHCVAPTKFENEELTKSWSPDDEEGVLKRRCLVHLTHSGTKTYLLVALLETVALIKITLNFQCIIVSAEVYTSKFWPCTYLERLSIIPIKINVMLWSTISLFMILGCFLFLKQHHHLVYIRQMCELVQYTNL